MTDRKTILVVEDSEIIIELLTMVLEREGFDVLVARDGNQGKEAILNTKLDLIIMDIMLPFKSGLEVISESVNTSNKIPIIILSAMGGVEQTIEDAESLGISNIVSKPFVVKDLLTRVDKLLKTNVSA